MGSTLSHGLTPNDATGHELALRVRDPGDSRAGGYLQVEQRAALAASLATLADVDVTAITAGAIPALAAGPTGILFQAHASNANAIRLGSDATASRGMQLRAGQSVILSIDDASHMKAFPDSGGSGACVLIVSQA